MSQTHQLALEALHRLDQQGRIWLRLGLLDTTTGQYVYSDVTGQAGYVWATSDRGDPVPVINLAVGRNPGLRVWAKREGGDLVVQGSAPQEQIQYVGTSGVNPGVGPHVHAIGSGNDDPVESRRLLPGLVHLDPDLGGMNIVIEPFTALLDGEPVDFPETRVDLTASIPVSANTWSWVLVGADLVTLAAVITAGTAQSLAIPLDRPGLLSITLGARQLALQGVQISNGQTVLSDSNFSDGDCRPLVNIPGNGAAGALTISGGAITVTRKFHKVDTEGGAASDDLDTINGGSEGDVVILRAANDTHTVVAKNSTANLKLAGSDMSLDSVNDTLLLIYDGTNWLELSRSNNG